MPKGATASGDQGYGWCILVDVQLMVDRRSPKMPKMTIDGIGTSGHLDG